MQSYLFKEAKVFSICQFHAGSCWNVIPDDMWMEGTIRTLNPDVRAYYIDRVEAIVKNIAEVMRCECSVEWPEGVPVVLNDSEFTSLVEDSAKIVLGEEYVSDSMKPSMGNEDFA